MIDLNIVFIVMLLIFFIGLVFIFVPCCLDLAYDEKYEDASILIMLFAVYIFISKNENLNNIGKIILYILYSIVFCITQIAVFGVGLIIWFVYYCSVLFMRIFSKKE